MQLQTLPRFVHVSDLLQDAPLNFGRILHADPFGAEAAGRLGLARHVANLDRADSGEHFREGSADDDIGDPFKRHTSHAVADEAVTPDDSLVGKPVVISALGNHGPEEREGNENNADDGDCRGDDGVRHKPIWPKRYDDVLAVH